MIWTPRPDVTDWARWFAWHPVKLEDGRMAWLSSVERMCAGWGSNGENPIRLWRYRALTQGAQERQERP